MYCTMHELVRLIGREKVLRIFVGPSRRGKLKRIEQEVTEETEIFSVSVLSVCSCLSLGFIGCLTAESGDAKTCEAWPSGC